VDISAILPFIEERRCIGGRPRMPRSKAKRKKTLGAELASCCGQVCDERCWESSIREHQFDRRLSISGGVRVS